MDSKKFLDYDGLNYYNALIKQSYVTGLGTSGNYLTWTKNGTTNNITVPFATNSTTATKLGSSTVGDVNKPIYLNAGTPTAVSKISGMLILGSGINSLISSTSAVGINPAINGTGMNIASGGNVRFLFDGFEIVFNSNVLEYLFDGLNSTYLTPFNCSGSIELSKYTYNSSTTYSQGDIVIYKNTSNAVRWYRSKTNNNVGHSPSHETDNTYWEYISGDGNYAIGINPAKITKVEMLVTLAKSASYECGVSMYWRTNGQHPRYVTIEKYSDATFETLAGTCCTNQDMQNETVSTVYCGNVAGSSGKYFKFTFTGFSGTTYWAFSLCQLAFSGLVGGIEGTVVMRRGGDYSSMYGNFYPYTTESVSLGQEAKRWLSLYVKRIYINGILNIDSNSTNGDAYINFNRSNNNYINVPTGGTLAVTVNGVSSANSRLYVSNTEVTPGTTNGTINLGTSSYNWNNVYAKKFITKDGTSSKFVKGDGSLDSNTYLKSSDISAWAKASTKPSYTASEVGAAPAPLITEVFIHGNNTVQVEEHAFETLSNAISEGRTVYLTTYDGYLFSLCESGDDFLLFTHCNSEENRISTITIYDDDSTEYFDKNFFNAAFIDNNASITIADGDGLLVTDASDKKKIVRTSLLFDGSTTTQALSKKGTWETFLTSFTETDPTVPSWAKASTKPAYTLDEVTDGTTRKLPATNVIPSESTANKVLLSTSTGGTAAWSSWSTAGLLKTNTSGVISIDTNTYLKTSQVKDWAKSAAGNLLLQSGELVKRLMLIDERSTGAPVYLGCDNGITASVTDHKVGSLGTTNEHCLIISGDDASTSAKGVVKLSSATDSTSETVAATAKAVKLAYDNGGVQSVGGSTGAVELKTINSTSLVGSGDISVVTSVKPWAQGAIRAYSGGTTTTLSDGSASYLQFQSPINAAVSAGVVNISLGNNLGVVNISTDGRSTWNDYGKLYWDNTNRILHIPGDGAIGHGEMFKFPGGNSDWNQPLEIASKSYVDGLVGDIETLLAAI